MRRVLVTGGGRFGYHSGEEGVVGVRIRFFEKGWFNRCIRLGHLVLG